MGVVVLFVSPLPLDLVVDHVLSADRLENYLYNVVGGNPNRVQYLMSF